MTEQSTKVPQSTPTKTYKFYKFNETWYLQVNKIIVRPLFIFIWIAQPDNAWFSTDLFASTISLLSDYRSLKDLLNLLNIFIIQIQGEWLRPLIYEKHHEGWLINNNWGKATKNDENRKFVLKI